MILLKTKFDKLLLPFKGLFRTESVVFANVIFIYVCMKVAPSLILKVKIPVMKENDFYGTKFKRLCFYIHS